MPIRFDSDADAETPPAKRRRVRGWAIGCGGIPLVLAAALWGYVQWATYLPRPPARPPVRLPEPNGFDAVSAIGMRFEGSPLAPKHAGLAQLRQELRRHRKDLAELHAALKLPLQCPPSGNPLDHFSGPVDKVWLAGRALGGEAKVRLAGSDGAGGWESGLDAVELGLRLQRGGSIEPQYLGDRICLEGVAALDGTAGQLTVREIRGVGARLDRLLQAFPPAEEALTQELAEDLEGLPLAFESTPVWGSGVSPSQSAQTLAYRYLYPRRWAHAELSAYLNRMIVEARKPSWQRARVPLPDNPFALSLVLNPLHQEWHTRTLAHLQLLRLQLALEEFRADRGGYPARLQELSPRFVRVLPPDPFTPRPYLYRRQGSDYLLYSIGEDRKDDGGTRSAPPSYESGDLVAGELFPPRLIPAPK